MRLLAAEIRFEACARRPPAHFRDPLPLAAILVKWLERQRGGKSAILIRGKWLHPSLRIPGGGGI